MSDINVTDQRPKAERDCLPEGMERPKKRLPVDPKLQEMIEAFAAKHGIVLKASQRRRAS